ncbi:hypothetical protein D3C71_1888300 [compost metagenome]
MEGQDYGVLVGVVFAQLLSVFLAQERNRGTGAIQDAGLQEADEGGALLGLLRASRQQGGCQPDQRQQAEQRVLVRVGWTHGRSGSCNAAIVTAQADNRPTARLQGAQRTKAS